MLKKKKIKLHSNLRIQKKRKFRRIKIQRVSTFLKFINYSTFRFFTKSHYFGTNIVTFSNIALEELGTKYIFNHWLNLYLVRKYTLN